MKKFLPAGILSLAVVAGVIGVWSVHASGQAAPPLGPHKQANLPPMPFAPGDPLPRPTQQVRDVFKFAAEHPEVLTYVPCFCGCEHLGHQGNEQCFVKSRDAKGDVTAWEPHGTECQVCLDVGRDAMQMFYSGASVRDIRNAVEKKYASQFRNHTPTPAPPAKASY